MSRAEIAAWVQVVLGGLSLILTSLTATPAINAAVRASSVQEYSGSFQGAQGAIQIFAVVLVMAASMAFLLIGLAVILGRLFTLIEASAPYHAAFCVAVALLLVAVTATTAFLGSGLWIWPLLQAIVCVILAGQAQVDPGKETFWTLMIVGSVSSFLVGLSLGTMLQGDPFDPARRHEPNLTSVQPPAISAQAP
jgi:glucan phosphoethanolaminetransferase (alkaline phosphatase superfamily)